MRLFANRFPFALALVLTIAVSPAVAEIGTIDNVPAATLLLPYFEVDLADPGGVTTLFSVNNASDEPVLAHLTIWSEFSVPVLDFDIYLTGYDIQTFNLRQLLENGAMPATGSAISNQGIFSRPNANFPGCSDGAVPGQTPNYGTLPEFIRTGVQQALTGNEITAAGFAPGLCASFPTRQTVARGYITIDSVSRCSQEFPNSSNYFEDGGTGVANNKNVLWGDYILCNIDGQAATGFNMVHIEADESLSVAAGACDPTDFNPTTFYCRYGDFPGEDNREALGSEYAVRYLAGGAFDGGTTAYIYRDPNRPGFVTDCGTSPFSMTMQNFVIFDEQENPELQMQGPGLPSSPFGQDDDAPVIAPFETNAVNVGIDFDVMSPFGFLLLDLDEAVAPGESNQGWVSMVLRSGGQFSVGFDAEQLNNLTLP